MLRTLLGISLTLLAITFTGCGLNKRFSLESPAPELAPVAYVNRGPMAQDQLPPVAGVQVQAAVSERWITFSSP